LTCDKLPHWFPRLRTISWKDYQVWSWAITAKAIGSLLSPEANTWHNYVDLEQTKLEAAEVLGIFKPKQFHKELPVEFEWDLETVPVGALQTPINSLSLTSLTDASTSTSTIPWMTQGLFQ
jgi:hypothetical protein